jgi:hypothetical protein
VSSEPEKDSKWETDIIEAAKKRIWIGLFQTPKHAEYEFIDIPNYYDFTHIVASFILLNISL